MNRWTLALLATDYRRMRRQQLGREPSEEEIRAINGFVEYVIAVEQVTHTPSPLMQTAELVRG